jgi:type VI secretion system protein ImpH
MADPTGQEADHLAAKLKAKPYGFDFYRAVRLLENHFRDMPRVGASQRLREDFIRFGQRPSLAFAPSTVDRFEPAGGENVARLYVNFLGLLGPNGPLPTHVTEFVLGRILNHKDHTLARFLDVLNHRTLSLFYRAWAAAQKSVDFDRPDEARFPAYVGSIFGIGMDSLRDRDSVPDRAKLYFSGRLACQTRNAEGLKAILEDFFEIPTEIVEFVGMWMEIPPENQCRLGESPATGSLGQSALAGARKYETQMKFRVRMGPMRRRDLERLLPGGAAFKRLKDWLANYVGFEFVWDLQCVVLKEEVPATQLGMSGMLGLSTWISSQSFKKDADDPIFDPANYA